MFITARQKKPPKNKTTNTPMTDAKDGNHTQLNLVYCAPLGMEVIWQEYAIVALKQITNLTQKYV